MLILALVCGASRERANENLKLCFASCPWSRKPIETQSMERTRYSDLPRLRALASLSSLVRFLSSARDAPISGSEATVDF